MKILFKIKIDLLKEEEELQWEKEKYSLILIELYWVIANRNAIAYYNASADEELVRAY